jgi:hypothetical protein
MASRSHWLTAPMMVITQTPRRRAGVQRFRDGNQRDLALLEEFQQSAQIFDATGEPVELGPR